MRLRCQDKSNLSHLSSGGWHTCHIRPHLPEKCTPRHSPQVSPQANCDRAHAPVFLPRSEIYPGENCARFALLPGTPVDLHRCVALAEAWLCVFPQWVCDRCTFLLIPLGGATCKVRFPSKLGGICKGASLLGRRCAWPHQEPWQARTPSLEPPDGKSRQHGGYPQKWGATRLSQPPFGGHLHPIWRSRDKLNACNDVKL